MPPLARSHHIPNCIFTDRCLENVSWMTEGRNECMQVIYNLGYLSILIFIHLYVFVSISVCVSIYVHVYANECHCVCTEMTEGDVKGSIFFCHSPYIPVRQSLFLNQELYFSWLGQKPARSRDSPVSTYLKTGVRGIWEVAWLWTRMLLHPFFPLWLTFINFINSSVIWVHNFKVTLKFSRQLFNNCF